MIEVRNLAKSIDGQSILKDLDFSVKKGEIVGLIGPSGCGKTTFMKLLVGIDRKDKGEIQVGAKLGDGTLSYMLQESMLLPWLTLEQNIMVRQTILKNNDYFDLKKFYDSINFSNFNSVYPHESSGGMKRCAVLGRSIIGYKQLLLLDEPFSGMDIETKLSVQGLLLDMRKKNGTTIVFVSHELDDALALADRLVLLAEKPAKTVDSFSVGEANDPHDLESIRQTSKFSKELQRLYRVFYNKTRRD